MRSTYKIYSIKSVIGILLLTLSTAGCKKLVEVDGPVTSTNAANVYNSDATAAAVLTGIYTIMSAGNGPLFPVLPNPGITSTSVFLGLSADELTLDYLSSATMLAYYSNQLESIVSSTAAISYWTDGYTIIFDANSAIQGLAGSTGLTPAVKQQLTGEAKFIRAFYYFYLVNLYGDVPLVNGTDYTVNSLLPRAPKAQVWQQIINDLKDAQNLLSANYVDASLLKTTAERVRPTKWAASALLARVYLYTGDWANAEAEADSVINNSSLFKLSTLSNTFLKASSGNNEAIWQLQPTGTGTASNTGDGSVFILPATGPVPTVLYPVYLNNTVINSFEANDQRKTNWVNHVTVGPTTYYYPYKYKIGAVNTAAAEYLMVLRLGEQYLIRAEARARQNNITGATGAAADLNMIRSRAGLPGNTAATQTDMLMAIQHERQVELFTEWGHRWLDLKRAGTIDGVMGGATGACQAKGGTWKTEWQWYPLPIIELQRDPNLVQNAGY
jgi:hypothetical protein